MIEFKETDFSKLDEEADIYEDRLIFQTREWVEFIRDTQHAEPILLRVLKDKVSVGIFTGLLFKKFGIKIVGSPFRGWTTLYMGFNLKSNFGIERAELVEPLWAYLKKHYGCLYCEIIDRYISEEEAQKYHLTYSIQESYGLNLNRTEKEILEGFTKGGRRDVRRFERNDATIHIVKPDKEFAHEFYEQLKIVFGYQGLVPSYDYNRVARLLKAFENRDWVLCQRAIDPEGNCRGTSISFGYNKFCSAWGNTSLREGIDYCQSEGLEYHAIKFWLEKGCTQYDLAGVREYKKKYNPDLIRVPRIILTRYKVLVFGRNMMEKIYWKINAIKGKLSRKN